MEPRDPQVAERARSHFADANPAHDWFHVRRVHATATSLAEAEDADPTTVELAVLLHDIGRAREDRGEVDNHAAWGAETAADILRDCGYGPERTEAVAHCIRSHRYSEPPEPETIEAKVLSDADNLDALGAIGVARAFTYGAQRQAPIADPDLPAADDPSEAGQTSLNHLKKKILSLTERMYTETGRSLAGERQAYVAEYVDRLEDELAGRR